MLLKTIVSVLGLAVLLYVAYHLYLISYSGTNPFQ